MTPTAEQILSNKVGTERPTGRHEVHARYVGRRYPGLFGKYALVAKSLSGGIAAQFDCFDTGFAFGWHSFRVADFERAVANDARTLAEVLGV